MARSESEQEKRLQSQMEHFGRMKPSMMVDIKAGQTLPGLSEEGKPTIAKVDTQVKAFDLREGLGRELDALRERLKARSESALTSREQTGGSTLVGGTVSTIPSLTSVLA